MQFLFNENAGNPNLSLRNEDFTHLKVRRVKCGEKVFLRNFKDDFLYEYEIINLAKNSCELKFLNATQNSGFASDFKIALSVIDVKILEKTLPFLNELGVAKLILVFSYFSQGNFKPDLKRFERILINSSQQCGRSDLMQIELFKSVDEFLQNYSEVVLVDFDAKAGEFDKSKLYFIGPEAGFSHNERAKFKEKISLNCPHILKSQTAITALCAKILL